MDSCDDTAPPGENGIAPGPGSTKSSKLDGMLGKLQKDVDDAGSSADSPAGKDQSLEEASSPGTSTAKEKEHRGGSSRRKPKVTRKVVESEGEDEETNTLYARIQEMLDGDFLEDDADDDAPPPPGADESNNDQSRSVAMSPACDSPKPSTSTEMEVDTDVLRLVDMESDDFIIPEGTVVVQPEAVLESQPIYNGPEFRHNKKTNKVSCDLSNVICSACNKKINPNTPGSAKRHPVLKVLLCKRCYTWYTSDEIDQDVEGMDEQCRWCGDGGNLICCDSCNNAFCKACIKRNLGRTELSNLLDAGDNVKWHCYVCDPKPLAPLIDECTTILAAIDELERKEKARQIAKKDNKMRPKPIIVVPQQHQPPQQLPKQSFMTIQQQQQQQQQQQRLLQQQRMAAGKTTPAGRGVLQANNPGVARTVQWDIPINEFNCGNILDRMLASTQSMNMVLTSMKEDLRSIAKHGGVSEQFVRREIGNKLKRAMVAFKKSFDDITLSAHSTQMARGVRPQQSRSSSNPAAQVRPVSIVRHGAPVTQSQPKVILMRTADGKLVRMPIDAMKNSSMRQVARSGVITPSMKQDQRRPVPSRQSSDVVVILSDSSDDEHGPTVAKRAEASPAKDTSSANHSEVESESGKSGAKRKSFQLRVSLDKGSTPESKRRRIASGDDGRKKKDAEMSDDGKPLSERLDKEAEEAKVKAVHDREARRLLRQARREREEPKDGPAAIVDASEDDPKNNDVDAEKDSGRDDADDNNKSDEETAGSDKTSARNKSKTKKRDAKSKSDGNESDADDNSKSDKETAGSDKTSVRNKSKTEKRVANSKSDESDDNSKSDEETAGSNKTSTRNKSKTKKRDAKSKSDGNDSDGDNSKSDKETAGSDKTSVRNKSKTRKRDAKSESDESDGDDKNKSSVDAADEETASSDKTSARNKSKSKKRDAKSESDGNESDNNSHGNSGSDDDSPHKPSGDDDTPSKPKDVNDSPSKPSSDNDSPSKRSGGNTCPGKSVEDISPNSDDNDSPSKPSGDNDSPSKSTDGNKSLSKPNGEDDHSEKDADSSLTNGLISEKCFNRDKSTSHKHNGDGDTKSDDDDIEISDGDLLDSDGADDATDVIDISDASPIKDAFRAKPHLNGKNDSPNRTNRGDAPKGRVVQVDGAPDRRDTSNTSDSSGAGMKHETSEDIFGSLSFEPLFEIQPMDSDSNVESEAEVKRKAKAVKRSRADIEAQRVLHKELLEDSGSQSDAVGATSDGDSDEDITSTDNIASGASSGDVYDPYKTKDKTDKHRDKRDSTQSNQGRGRKLKKSERSSRRQQHRSRNSSGDNSETEAKTSKNKKHKSRRDKRSDDELSKRKAERKSSKKSCEHSDSDDFEVVTLKSRFNREKDSRKSRGEKVKREDSESESRHRKGKKDSSTKGRRGDSSKVKSESVHRKGKRDGSSYSSGSESRSRQKKKDSRKHRHRSEEDSDKEAKDRGKSRKGRKREDGKKEKKRGRHSKDSEESSSEKESDKEAKRDREKSKNGRKGVDDKKEKAKLSRDSENSSNEEESDMDDRGKSKKGRKGVDGKRETARRSKDSGENSNEKESDKDDREKSKKNKKGVDDKKAKRRGRRKESEESSNEEDSDKDDGRKSRKSRQGVDDKKEKKVESEESSNEASTSKKNGESREENSPDPCSPTKSIADPSSTTKSRRLSKIGVKSTRKNVHTSDDSSNDDYISRKRSKSRNSSGSEDVEDLLRRKTRRRRDRRKKAHSDDDNEHARSSKQKDGKKSRKSDGKLRPHSDSDSELEKDIDRLSKMPVLSSRRGEDSDSEVDGEESGRKKLSYQELKKKRAEAKFKVKESKSKKGRYDDLDSDGEKEVEEEDELDEQDEIDEAMNKVSDDDDNGPVLPMSDDDPDDRARKALFADDSGDDDDNSDNDDVDTDTDESSKASKRKSSKQTKEMEAEDEDDDASASDESEGTRKARNKSSKLLDAKLSDTDDDDSDVKQKSTKKKGRGKKKKRFVGSSSEDDDRSPTDESSDDASSSEDKKTKKRKRGRGKRSDSSDDSDSSGKKKTKGKKKRRRIKKMESSNSDKSGSGDGDSDDDHPASVKRRKIRKILKDKKLSDQTVAATKAESDRRKRIKERQELYNEVTVEDANSPTKCPKTTKLVLEMDPETKKPIIQVLPALICLLKPHQVQAVKFLWDCCAESLDQLKKDEGSGCILAHCMGLGKTLSVITFLHTLMSYGELTGVRTAVIVCPLNTVLNWENEWDKWLTEDEQFDVYEMSSVKNNEMRAQVLKDWQNDGGILIIGYEMYRNLTLHRNIRNKRLKKTFSETLVDPGPDFVVCDEGHILKNESTAVSKALNAVKTRRRVVLTGTPLQNNLIEYHCMVNFVKPNLLGSKKEFCNRFVNPITNGQCANSTERDVKIMKRRAHVLHESLAGCVQRKDYSALTKFLMPKHEYVLSIRLSKVQMQLYEKYLDLGSNEGRMKLFADYQALMRIWTHPWVLRLAEIREQNKATYDTDDSFIKSMSEDSSENESVHSDSDDDVQVIEDKKDKDSGSDKDKSGSDHEEVVSRWKTRSRGGLGKKSGDASPDTKSDDGMLSSEWWASYVNKDSEFDMSLSGKLVLLAQVLKMSESIGDKVLVFSQSLLSLNLIEAFLERWDTDSATKDGEAGMQGWTLGADYFRMDGSSSAQQRHNCAAMFNAEENVRARLFLISTKAGSLGTNLVAANRVIIFDASWNPSHDVQSIFRVYRFGQLKPVYVYRFLAQGTMEEKIYERQVTKQSLAQRVVDEHQIERHFNMADLQELYNFTPDRLDDPNRTERPIPKLPKDRLLAELLVSEKDWIVQYHEHDSLLENKIEEELTEEERKAAWDEFENDKLEVRQQPHPRLAPMYAGYPDQQQQVPPGEMAPSAESIARAIYAANPQLTMAELQSRTVQYLSAMAVQRQQYQRQQEYLREMRRLQQRQRENDQMMAAAQRMAGSTWPHNATPEQMLAASQLPRNTAQTGGSLEDMLTRK